MAIRLLSFLLFLLFSSSSGAQASLPLDAGVTHAELWPYTRLLRDPNGTMRIDDAIAAERSAVPLSAPFNVGFTQDALWLRIELTRREGAAQDWLLEVNNAVMDDVRLYQQNEFGAWVERRAGEEVPRAQWPVKYRNAVFPLRISEAEHHTLWLKIAARNSISAQLSLWAPAALGDAARDEALAYGLLFGAYVMIVIIYLFFWLTTGEVVSGWYTAYVANSLFQMLITFGFLQEYTGMPGWISDALLALLICTTLGIGGRLSAGVLELSGAMPRFNRWFVRGTALASVITTLLAAVEGYAVGVGLAQLLATVEILSATGIATYLWRRGHRPAGLYLLAYGLFCIGVLLRVMRNFTLLPPNFATDNGFQIGAIAHMIVMSLLIMERYNTMKLAAMKAQAEALRIKTEREEDLNIEIGARTASLSREISRREALESDLRKSLEVEKQALQEQLDFVAMVSHEFRTPLAIIDTCAQRVLGAQPAAETTERCEHIREATRRMTRLMDEFLSLDRINGELRTFTEREETLAEMVDKAVAEWRPARIEVSYDGVGPRIFCDAGLLHIALRNLLANAIRHSPPDVPVYLQVLGVSGGGVRFEIANAGQEIPADEIAKLFQKYFRGRGAQNKPGIGLGLYLVKRIATLHRGTVSVTSGAEGSCFALTIGAS